MRLSRAHKSVECMLSFPFSLFPTSQNGNVKSKRCELWSLKKNIFGVPLKCSLSKKISFSSCERKNLCYSGQKCYRHLLFLVTRFVNTLKITVDPGNIFDKGIFPYMFVAVLINSTAISTRDVLGLVLSLPLRFILRGERKNWERYILVLAVIRPSHNGDFLSHVTYSDIRASTY